MDDLVFVDIDLDDGVVAKFDGFPDSTIISNLISKRMELIGRIEIANQSPTMLKIAANLKSDEGPVVPVIITLTGEDITVVHHKFQQIVYYKTISDAPPVHRWRDMRDASQPFCRNFPALGLVDLRKLVAWLVNKADL